MEYKAPLRVHAFETEPAWIDMNGHVNVAYFVMMFDLGIDGFQAQVDLGEDYLDDCKMSTFAVQYHVHHLAEMMVAEKGYVNCQLIDFDTKRIHLFQTMHRASNDQQVAAMEIMLLNVDTNIRKAVAMPVDRLENLGRLETAHKAMPRPALLGKSLGIQDHQPS